MALNKLLIMDKIPQFGNIFIIKFFNARSNLMGIFDISQGDNIYKSGNGSYLLSISSYLLIFIFLYLPIF